MSGRPWIKQSTTKIDDARLALCSDAAQRDYFMLYLLAGRLDADGLFVESGRQLSDEEIAFKIRIKAARLKTSINEMKKARLLHVNGKGPQIVDYQNEQQSWREKQEQTRERVARYRERVAHDGEVVTPLEESQSQSQSQIRKESLLLLSQAHQQKISSHPEWMDEAIEIATTKGKLRPDYVAGIMKNFITEGRKGVKHGNDTSSRNHKRANKQGPEKKTSAYSTSDRQAAKRVLAKRAKAHV